MARILCHAVLSVLFLLLLSSLAPAGVIDTDAVWQGEVRITEDILVPEGITLTVRPGTTVKIASAESTKTDPEYLSSLTEITIRGTLRVEGTDTSPVKFSGEEKKAGAWAGILVDHGAIIMTGCRVMNADTGVYVMNGNLFMKNSELRENRYGLVAQGDSADVTMTDSRIADNDYGVFALGGANVAAGTVIVRGNKKRDRYTAAKRQFSPEARYAVNEALPVGRHYRDEVLLGDTVWQGRVVVDGIVRVPTGSRLIILQGTLVEFRKYDTNGDGIGENGILVQGRIVAKGTPDQPILFRSAEKVKRMGDWDSINIMNSDGAQNIIEHCRIEHAYRGLHFHFSHVAVHNSVLRNNYRGIQFQESLVEMKGNHFYGNKSGVQGRDSEVVLFGNVVSNNYVGINFFRAALSARGNTVLGNWKEGWRVREGMPALQENLIDGNRFGLMVADTYFGEFSRNSISANSEIGLSMRNIDNGEIYGNVISGNGLNGLNIQDSRAHIKGNLISDNGERGMGILSFDGVITENNIAGNGLYAIDLDGERDVSAVFNWWGGDDADKILHDKGDDPSRGTIHYEKPSEGPFSFAWPLQSLLTDATWRGAIAVNHPITVSRGVVLRIAPETKIEFSKGTGLAVKGRLSAEGTRGGKILFTSMQKQDAADWDELLIEHAEGSVIAHCIFEYATWGIHSHFTNLTVTDSHFRKNYGGMRFRSGPVVVKNSLFEDNAIGIRSYRGNALITANNVTRNDTGIFVREKGSGLQITNNNLFSNSNYNIRVGDFNSEDVRASNNWWGHVNPADTIFDGRKEPGIGKVLFEPHLQDPVDIDLGQ